MADEDSLFHSRVFTGAFGFTRGIEGPATDREGNLYAVNYQKQHTIGKITPEGECSIFMVLPNGSIGNGIRFNQVGEMLIADYINHNIFKVDMVTKAISVFAHDPRMNQPNDICITSGDVLFASDPDWNSSTGNLWRIDQQGNTRLIESRMGTTNGIEVDPTETRLYVNETIQRRIWVYDLSPDYEVHNKRLFIEFDDFGLDGMRCDQAGNLYVTRYGKGTIVKLSPSGDILQEILLHGKNCTNLTFGGADGRMCYVTIADQGNIETFRVDIPGRCWSMYKNPSTKL